MPSVVQALASMLSAGADASSRVTAAGLGANAHMAAANAGLQGDMYRTNSTNQLGNRNLDSNNQQFQAEQFLRSAMAGQNFGLQNRQLEQQGQYQTGQLGVQRDQLGLQREQMGVQRDLKLGEMGQGPYAPQMPNFDDLLGGQQPGGSGQPATTPRYEGAGDWLQQLLGFGKQQQQPQSGGASMEIAKRMIASRNPQLMQQGMALLQHAESQGRQQAESQRDFDFKKGAMSDPNALFAMLAPSVAGMEGVTPQNLASVLAQLRAQLGGRAGSDGASLSPASPTGPLPTITQAQSSLQQYAGDPIIEMLGGDQAQGMDIARRIGSNEQAILGDPLALAKISEYIRARAAANPNFTKGGDAIRDPAYLLKSLLEGGDIRGSLQRRRDSHKATVDEVLKSGGDFGMFGSF